MVKNKILAEYWTLKEVNDAFAKMHPEELQYDLKAEVFLVLCEMNEEKLIGLYERNELKFYIVRIMLNMIKSDRSTFYKNYRNYTEFIDPDYVKNDGKDPSFNNYWKYVDFIEKKDRKTFYKKKSNNTEYIDTDHFLDNDDRTNLFEKLETNMNGLHWYNATLFKLYAIDFKKNAKELSRKTGIPYMSIVRTINKTKKQMKTNIRK